MVFSDYTKGLHQDDSLENLKQPFGKNAPSRTKVLFFFFFFLFDFLDVSEVQLLPHSPYSPDLFPCDFLLITKMKKHLKGTLSESAEDVCRAFTRAVEDVAKSTWVEEWNRWFHRM